jgi:hypothetical protein
LVIRGTLDVVLSGILAPRHLPSQRATKRHQPRTGGQGPCHSVHTAIIVTRSDRRCPTGCWSQVKYGYPRAPTVQKRHHVRVWQYPARENIWLGVTAFPDVSGPRARSESGIPDPDGWKYCSGPVERLY